MLDAVRPKGLCAGRRDRGHIDFRAARTAQLKDLVKHFDLVGMGGGAALPSTKVIDGRPRARKATSSSA